MPASLRPRITPRARRELDRIVTWWRIERPAAPDLALEELASALETLCSAPQLGQPYRGGRAGTRRFLLTQSRFHVYFCVRDTDLFVLSVWSALRGAGPRISG